MTTLTFKVNAYSIKAICNYLPVIMRLYKKGIQVILDKRSIEVLTKYATSYGEFDGFGHIAYYTEKNVLIFGLVYDLKHGIVRKTEIMGTKNILQIEPSNFPDKTLSIVYDSKRKKKNRAAV